MAAALGTLPVKVIWQLPQSALPDEAALRQLGTGSNTKVCLLSLRRVFTLLPRFSCQYASQCLPGATFGKICVPGVSNRIPSCRCKYPMLCSAGLYMGATK